MGALTRAYGSSGNNADGGSNGHYHYQHRRPDANDLDKNIRLVLWELETWDTRLAVKLWLGLVHGQCPFRHAQGVGYV